jgi:hypothetical protein
MRVGGGRRRESGWLHGACDAIIRLRGDVDPSVTSLAPELINQLPQLEVSELRL